MTGVLLLTAGITVSACASEAAAPATSPAASEATAAATSASSAAASGSASELCPDGSIKIGIAKAKTGGFEFFDSAGANGSQIAFDQLNAAGGIDGCTFDVMWEDTKSDPAQGQQAAQNLIDAGAQVIILPSDFDLGAPASLAAQAAGLFAMSPEASSPDWTVAAAPYTVVQALTSEDTGRGQAGFAAQKSWDSTYVVTNEAYNFFKEMEGAFTDAFGGTIVGRSVVADDATDYSAVISKIRGLSPAPSFIYLNDYFPHVGTFVKQMLDAGLTIPVLGNGTYASPDLVNVIGPKRVKDVYYVSQAFYEGPTASADALSFVKDYEATFGGFPPNANAQAGYEGVMGLAEALKAAGTTDAAALTAAMTAQKEFSVAGGEIYEWTDKVTSRRASVVGFDDAGVAVEAATIDPRTS